MIAQAMRDAEVEAGAPAPKIHSLDDYFMTEVEHVEVEDEEQRMSHFARACETQIDCTIWIGL